METERENAVKFDATAERRSCGRVEIFDLGITVCLPEKSRQNFFRLEKLARCVIPSEMGVSHGRGDGRVSRGEVSRGAFFVALFFFCFATTRLASRL
jgi:hypothetical protein